MTYVIIGILVVIIIGMILNNQSDPNRFLINYSTMSVMEKDLHGGFYPKETENTNGRISYQSELDNKMIIKIIPNEVAPGMSFIATEKGERSSSPEKYMTFEAIEDGKKAEIWINSKRLLIHFQDEENGIMFKD